MVVVNDCAIKLSECDEYAGILDIVDVVVVTGVFVV